MNRKIKKEGMLAIGMFSLILSLFLNMIGGNIPIVDFFCGLFTDLSITMNLSFLIIYRRQNSK
ncbi:MAG: hypothetical protein ACFFA3_06850 [Promethearchaeota archaeon]